MYPYADARTKAEKMFGPPIGEGRNRVTFRDGNEVVKVPKHGLGVNANRFESSTSGENLAKCYLDESLAKFFGVPGILRMEYVDHVGFSQVSDWTWGIDCGQVGHTLDGRLVAYDWETY